MNKNLKLNEFLEASRRVTDNYIEAWGKWDLIKQWDKINEEDEEFALATNNLNKLEEFWDCFFARLTLLHLEDIDDYAIFTSAISTWNKINERSQKAITNTRCRYQNPKVTEDTL